MFEPIDVSSNRNPLLVVRKRGHVADILDLHTGRITLNVMAIPSSFYTPTRCVAP